MPGAGGKNGSGQGSGRGQPERGPDARREPEGDTGEGQRARTPDGGGAAGPRRRGTGIAPAAAPAPWPATHRPSSTAPSAWSSSRCPSCWSAGTTTARAASPTTGGEPPAQPGDAIPCRCPECRCPAPGGKYVPNRALGQLADRARESAPAWEGPSPDEELLGEPLFCMDHGSLTRALDTEHWGHRCLPLAESVQQYKEILTMSQTSLEARIQAAKSLQEQRAQKVPEIADIKSFLEKHCPGEEKGAPLPAPRDFSLGQFKGPIQYVVWREMKSALSLALPLVTLDPATNHPNLLLSPDRLAVRLVDEPQEEAPEGPERFSKSVCVLGSAGFTSGRHYWEVEVGDKTSWDIGLARASVNRQEAKVMLKPANGYWAVWLRHGADYKALDSPSRHLALQAKPRRVGVYLDYEGGQVSFYDAAAMTHLYTFSDAFAEPLYPMLGPGVNRDGLNAEPLRLVEL
nr:zinc-binding protein A33-like [Chrysemys picta bellii]